MSGICGVYSPRNPSPASAETLRSMLAAMQNRGDGERIACPAPGAGLGLTSRQVFRAPHEEQREPWYEDGARVVLLDGTINDTHLGPDPGIERNVNAVAESHQAGSFPHSLRGTYSAAVWDAGLREMTLAADTLGSKTVYYYHSPASGLFAFASRLDALVQCTGVQREVDTDSLHVYLARGAIFAPYTIYKGVRKLLPGEVLTMGADGVLHSRIYHRQTAGTKLEASPEELAKLLRGEMTAAAGRAARNSQEVGVLLSSGVDSAVLLASLAEAGASCTAYTVVYEGGSAGDESGMAGETARTLGVEHRIVRVSETADAVFGDIFRAYDEPVEVTRGPTSYYLARALAADSRFASFNGISGENVYGGMDWKPFAAARRAAGDDMAAVDAILSRPTVLDVEDQNAILVDPISAEALNERILRPFDQLIDIADPYEKYSAALLLRLPTGRHGVSPSLVPYVFGVELRQGLRDQQLMDFGRTLPFPLKEGASFRDTRQLVRAAYGDRLPRLLRDMEKHAMPGFPWQHPAFDGLDRRLDASLLRLKASGLVHPEAVDRVLRKYREPGRSNRAAGRAWALFCLQTWFDYKVNNVDPFA